MKYFIEFYTIIILIISGYYCNCQDISDELENEFREIAANIAYEISSEFQIYNETGVMSLKLIELSKIIDKPSSDIKKIEIPKLRVDDQKLLCIACRTGAKLALEFVKNSPEAHSDNFKDIAVELCVFFQIQPRHVCEGVVDENWPALDYILRHQDSQMSDESLCGVLMQGSNCGIINPKFDWKLNVDPNYPIISSHKKFPSPSLLNSSNPAKLRILHLTDVHYDPSYVIGGNAECEEPLCCRTPLKMKRFSRRYSQGAGKWSDYRDCDVPLELYVNTLDQIKAKYGNSFDMIYFTGDIIEHAVWDTSKEGNKKSIKEIFKYMRDTFGNIPVFPILGNHEPHPLNLYAPDDVQMTRPDLSTQWLYDLVAEEWKHWLPDSNVQNTIRKGGYYTVKPREGFRIIALNNNDAYTLNFWLLYKPTYLAKQLQWMHNILLESEKSNEFVHILMHIPSGDETCFNTWSREFRRIIERFHNIIGGIFVGHTHADEFNVYYSMQNSKYAINVAWNGGSLTPYFDVNPNYRTYEVETISYQVTNHETMIFNLTEANMYPDFAPKWYKEYSFADAYEIKDLSLSSLNQLTEKFIKNKSLLKKYWKNKVKHGDPYLKKGCDNKCLENHYCEIVRTQSNDKSKCKKF